MNRIITPGNKDRSVVSPEKQEAALKDPLQHTRAMLFVGAIMGMAEEAAEYLEKDELCRPIRNEQAAAEHLIRLLAYCYNNKWNVAKKALELHTNRLEERAKEKEKAPSGA